MSIKSDRWIRQMATDHGMIEPFVDRQKREGIISYALFSFKKNMRVSDEFKIFSTSPYNTVVDPKAIDERIFQHLKGDVCIIPPNSYALCHSLEYFRIPADVLVLVIGKRLRHASKEEAQAAIFCDKKIGRAHV